MADGHRIAHFIKNLNFCAIKLVEPRKIILHYCFD